MTTYKNISSEQFNELIKDYLNADKLQFGGNISATLYSYNNVIMNKYLLVLICIVILWLVWRLMSKTVYWFYRDTCPHCVDMKPEWDKFEYQCMFSNIRPVRIDITDSRNQNIVDQYGVESVPTIIKIESGMGIVYNGNRTSQDLYEWVTRTE